MNPPSDMNNATRSSYHEIASYNSSRKFKCRYKHDLYQLAWQHFTLSASCREAKESFKILGRQQCDEFATVQLPLVEWLI